MNQQTDSDGNLDALKRLRALPRGTQVDSRIAAIQSLLGEKEIFRTLNMLRWPEGIVCPRCRSSNVIRRNPPIDAADQRHYYECLNCKGRGNISIFDDLTGLPVGTLASLRQSILCWYLIGFCSVMQIAKILGLSMSEVAQLAQIGSDLTDVPAQRVSLSAYAEHHALKKSKESTAQKTLAEDKELSNISLSRSPLRPGYKSKT